METVALLLDFITLIKYSAKHHQNIVLCSRETLQQEEDETSGQNLTVTSDSFTVKDILPE